MIGDRLRSMMRRHAREILTARVSFEVTVGAVTHPDGTVTRASVVTYTVPVSDIARPRDTYRDDTYRDDTAPMGDGWLYLPVPVGGLPFAPAIGQVVVLEDGSRWAVTAVTAQRVHGQTIGFRVEMARGGVDPS